MRTLLTRIAALFRRRSLDAALDDEVRAHLALLAADYERRGMAPADARRAARRAFGGVEQMKETYRDRRGLPYVDDLQRDVRYAVRALARTPAFTVVAVLSLGLGIGANAAIFGLFDAVLLKSLPVKAPEELVVLAWRRSGQTQDANHTFSYELFQAFRRENRSLADIVASASTRMSVDIEGVEEPTTQGQLVSGNYYAMLGVGPALGRVIAADDDGPAGARAVAVLSYAYWRRRFASESTVVGKTIRVNGYPFTIIGVAAPGFVGTRIGTPADITVPLSMQERVMPQVGDSWIRDPYQFWLQLLGRLKPGVPESRARADLDAINRRRLEWLVANADARKGAPFKDARLELEPGRQGLSELRSRYSRPLAVLMGVVTLVLLAACANVANLLLARAMTRRREIALRMSLGAGRSRLIRQLLTESLVIATLSCLVGLLIAGWSSAMLRTLLAGEQLSNVVAGPDLRVFLFTLTASLVTGLLFGLAPAFLMSDVHPQRALKDDDRSGAGRRLLGQGLLVSTQVAVSLTLLVGAGLFVRTLMNLRALDLGIDEERVLTLRLEPEGSNQKRQADGLFNIPLMRKYSGLLERVESVPGVRSASLSGVTPLGDENSLAPEIRIPGYLPKPGDDLRIRMMQIYPKYFSTLDIRILAGRDLAAIENEPSAASESLVTVINDTLARRFFGSASAAIGRRFARAGSRDVFEVVGVVEDVLDRGPRESVLPVAYASYTQAPTGRGQMTLVVRTAGDPRTAAATIRGLARSIDPNMPLFEMQTVAERLDASMAQERLLALLSSLFGALALLLASIGLYGVMAYAVGCRKVEFGVRMALGATRRAVVAMVFRESLWLVSIGVGLGLVVALAASSFISSRLFGVSAADPVTIAGAMLLLTAVAMMATLLPARRAAKVDPMLALRST